MVNHVRTWLGNQVALSAMTPGEEYIDPLFVPVPFSSMSEELRTLRQLLLPPSLPRYDMNARLCFYMSAIHNSAFFADVIAKDPRLTYLPDGSGIFESVAFSSGLANFSEDLIDKLVFIGSAESKLFKDFPAYLQAWNQPADPLKRLSVVLLATAAATEKAGVSAK